MEVRESLIAEIKAEGNVVDGGAEKALDDFIGAAHDVESAVDGAADAVKDLGDETDKTTKKVAKARDEKGRFRKSTDDVAESQRRAGKAAAEHGDQIQKLQRRAVQLAAGYIGLREAYEQVLAVPTRAFVEIDEGLVSIGKTTGIAGEELRGLHREIEALNTAPDGLRQTTSELLALGAAAGQVGVSGAANVQTYIDTFARLDAASDLHGEEAVKTLTRLLNVQGEGPEEVERMASVLVDLGNNSAASEAEIAKIANELGRATSVFRLGSTDVLAFSAAMASSGVQAELGGSAIGRTMREIQAAVSGGGADLERFAAVSGESAEQFARDWQADAVAQLVDFLEGIGETGADAGAVLKDLGLGGEELAKVLPPLGGNIDILGKSLARARGEASLFAAGMTELSALAKESGAAMGTAGADFDRFWNTVESVRFALAEGFVPALREVAAEWSAWLSENRGEAVEFGRVVAEAIGIASDALRLLVENADLVQAVVVAVVAVKLPAWIAAAGAAAATAGGSVTALVASLGLLAPALVAVVAAGKLLNDWAKASFRASGAEIDAATAKTRAFRDSLDDAYGAIASGDAAQIDAQFQRIGQAVGEAQAAADQARLVLSGLESDMTSMADETGMTEQQLREWAAGAKDSAMQAGVSALEVRRLAAEMVDAGSDIGAAEMESRKLEEVMEDLAVALSSAEGDLRKVGDAAGSAAPKLTAAQQAIADYLGRMEAEQVDQARRIAQVIGETALTAESAAELVQAILDVESKGGTQSDVERLTSEFERLKKEAAAARAEIAAALNQRMLDAGAPLPPGMGGPGLAPYRPDLAANRLRGAEFVEIDPSGESRAALQEVAERGRDMGVVLDQTSATMHAFGDALIAIGATADQVSRGLGGFVVGLGNVLNVIAAGGSDAEVADAAAGAVGAGIGAAFGGDQRSQFGGLDTSYAAEGAQLGGQIAGGWGALVGGVIGAMVENMETATIEVFSDAEGDAQAIVSHADEGLVRFASAFSGAINAFISGTEEVIGQTLTGTDLRLSVEGDYIWIIDAAGNYQVGFKDAGAALAYMQEQLIKANAEAGLFAEGIGENFARIVERVESNIGAMVSGDPESLQRAVVLAGQADRLAQTGVLPGAGGGAERVIEASREIFNQLTQDLRDATTWALKFDEVIALTDARIAALRDSIESEFAAMSGVRDFLGGIQDITSQMEQFGATTSQAARERVAAAEAAAAEVVRLEEEVADKREEMGTRTIQSADGTTQEVLRLSEGLSVARADMGQFGERLGTATTGMAEFVDSGANAADIFGSAITGAANEAFAGAKSLAELEQELEITREKSEALADSLGDIPEAFTAEEIAEVWRVGALQAADAVLNLFDQVEGGTYDASRAETIKNDLFMVQLAGQLAVLETILATAEALDATTRATLRGILDEGAAILAGLASGELTVASRSAAGGTDRFAQALQTLGGTLSAERQRFDDLREALEVMGRALDRGRISHEEYAQVVAEFSEEIGAGLLGAGAGLLEVMGESEKAAEFRRKEAQIDFRIRVASLELARRQLAAMGLLSDEVAAMIDEVLGLAADFEFPDPADEPPALPDLDPPRGLADFVSELQDLGDVAGMRELIDAIGSFDGEAFDPEALAALPEELAAALEESGAAAAEFVEELAAAVAQAREEIQGDLRGLLDEALNVGPGRRALREFGETMEELEKRVVAAYEGTEGFAARLAELDMIQRHAARGAGNDLAGSLLRLGVTTPALARLQERLRISQLNLARSAAIADAVAISATRGLDHLGLSLEDMIGVIDESFDLARSGGGQVSAQFDQVARSASAAADSSGDLDAALRAAADQTEEWMRAGMDPFDRALQDQIDRFAELRDAVISAGGSISQLTDLEEALAYAREQELEDLKGGIRERLVESERESPGLLPQERLARLQSDFGAAIDAALASPGEATFAEAEALFDQLSAFGEDVGLTGSALEAYLRDLRDQLGLLEDVELEDPAIPPIEAIRERVEADLPAVTKIAPDVVGAVSAIDTKAIVDAIGDETYKEIVDALGLIKVENIVTAIGEQPFGEIVNAIGGQTFTEIVTAIGEQPFGAIVTAIGQQPFGEIVNAIGGQTFTEIVTAIGEIPLSQLSDAIDTQGVIEAIGLQPFAALITAITGQPIDQVITALSPMVPIKDALGNEQGLTIRKLNVIRDRLTTIRGHMFDVKTDIHRLREIFEQPSASSADLRTTALSGLDNLGALAALQVDETQASAVSSSLDSGVALAEHQERANALLLRIAEQDAEYYARSAPAPSPSPQSDASAADQIAQRIVAIERRLNLPKGLDNR